MKEKLNCMGCANEMASLNPQEEYTNIPSGERPCHFCIRNDKRDLKPCVWYDGSEPIKVPMDCYRSLDMHEQINEWDVASDVIINKEEYKQ